MVTICQSENQKKQSFAINMTPSFERDDNNYLDKWLSPY